MAVEDALKAANIGECRIKLVRKLQIFAAVGDEDAKLAPVGRVSSARLVRSYIIGFRRSRTRCVMRDVYHCAPPSPALILAQPQRDPRRWPARDRRPTLLPIWAFPLNDHARLELL